MVWQGAGMRWIQLLWSLQERLVELARGDEEGHTLTTRLQPSAMSLMRICIHSTSSVASAHRPISSIRTTAQM